MPVGRSHASTPTTSSPRVPSSGTAVEINCRPERQDPPEELLTRALGFGCHIAIDTDARARPAGVAAVLVCDKAVRCEVPVERIVSTWSADDLLEWCGAHGG